MVNVGMAKRYVHLGDEAIHRAMSQKDPLHFPLQVQGDAEGTFGK